QLQRVDDGVARRAVLEEREGEVGQREVVPRERLGPRLRERRLGEDRVREDDRARQHREDAGERRPAPASERNRAPRSGLATHAGVATPAEQALLELEEQGRRQQERNRERGGLLDFRRVLEERPDLRRDRVEASRQREDGRRAEERQRLEHRENEAADDRRKRQRELDRQRHAQATRREDRSAR